MRYATTKKSEAQEAQERLRELLPPGSTVWTIVRHVSRSGMSRVIDCFVIHDGVPQWLSGYIRTAAGMRLHPRLQGIVVGGCGMDMGFHIVSNLSRVLYPDGFGCTGEGCPSNDHSNGDRDYTPHGLTDENGQPENREPGPGEKADGRKAHWHNAPDYALKQKWM